MKRAMTGLMLLALAGCQPAAPAQQIKHVDTPGSFHGYACTSDCSGHEAGYEWAEENGIHSPDDCGGNSQSFIEGCRAWAKGRE